MAKKTTRRANPPTDAAPRRKRSQSADPLAQLDRDLIELLNRRAELTRQQGTADGAETIHPADWASQWQRVNQAIAANQGPLKDDAIRAIFREVLSATRALLQPIRVIYLGPKYSFTHMAAVTRFGESAELVPVATIPSVFESLDRKQADFGLVPIENSTDGRIIDTLEMFARLPIQVCGEVQLRVHHHLLAKCSRAEVNEIYSKPQAISQCREWLAKQMPDADIVEMTSTAAAAKLAAEKRGAAAIASHKAGVMYGLDVIARSIEDNRHNMTRFAVIGNLKPNRTGRDKTSLMFEIHHSPGALADMMGIFKRNQLNLTWIESFPMSGTPNEYLFFVEFEGHRDDANAQRALTGITKKAVRLEVLGSYPISSPVE